MENGQLPEISTKKPLGQVVDSETRAGHMVHTIKQEPCARGAVMIIFH